MTALLKAAKHYLFAGIFLMPVALDENILATKIFNNVDKTITVIDTRMSVSASTNSGNFKSTGVIADKEHGLIVTSNHMTGGGRSLAVCSLLVII